ncbi:MAG: mandelate racemase, partial [Rhizobiaceae bacterium]
MTPPRVKLLVVTMRERPTRMRMPFRFGVTTATHGRQAIAAVRLRLEDGREGAGYAAEALGAKWFDKNLDLTDQQNHHQLRKALEMAASTYLAAPAMPAFDLFAVHYDVHIKECAAVALNPLIASYGLALLDRAVLDAVCRILGISFYTAIMANIAGIRPH